jgi:hypothetical protein
MFCFRPILAISLSPPPCSGIDSTAPTTINSSLVDYITVSTSSSQYGELPPSHDPHLQGNAVTQSGASASLSIIASYVQGQNAVYQTPLQVVRDPNYLDTIAVF